ncbi:Taurine import ATP-binding protein TauB [compost metagenome]
MEGASTAAYADWRAVGYLFQDDRLLPWRTARDNVCFGLEAGSLPRAERRASAREALAAVGLAEFESAYPHELSGGMRSRVALARSLVNQPRILLLDEPFSKLDPGTRAQMHAELLAIQASRGMTVVFVTHDVEEAIVLADQVVILQPRPGRIREIAPVTLARPRSPSMPEVAELIRQLRVLV